VALIETYFDESYDDSTLCVAGYIFSKLRCRKLTVSWKGMLRRYHLPYFRMSSCAYGNKPFHLLSRDQRIAVETEAINLIKKHAVRGVAVSVNEREFDNLLGDDPIIQNTYQFCVWFCLLGVRNWIEENNIRGDIAYLFEAGHQHQSAANMLMNNLFTDPGLKERYRYSAHGFVDKEKAPPCQASDLLAWQWYTQRKRINQRSLAPPRADLSSLLEKRHDTIHGSPAMLLELKKMIAEATVRYQATSLKA
jgi:hypothetical protein